MSSEMMALVAKIPFLIRSPRPSLRRLPAMLGPGYIVAVGYMDPGNWATDLAAGAHYGLALLGVVIAACLAAAFFQALVVRLTLASGQDLARLIRERFPRPVALALWAVAEVAMVATDLAELLGCAIALKLLCGLPLVVGTVLSAALTFLLLMGSTGARGGFAERIIGALVLMIALSLVVELSFVRSNIGTAFGSALPTAAMLHDPAMLTLSLGILGATIMPHNLYLHAGLARARLAEAGPIDQASAMRALSWDSAASLAFAGLVNVAILVLAAAAFQGQPSGKDIGLEDAYRLLDPALGRHAASLIFALALLASGQSSTATGTMAGQIVTEGFLDIRISPWAKAAITRLAALVPALAIMLAAGEDAADRLIILSQVVLGLALPFVLVPMLILLGNRAVAGRFALRLSGVSTAALLVAGLGALNLWLAGLSLA